MMSNDIRAAAVQAREATTQFDYLLNAMERAGQEKSPAQAGYGSKRKALFAYVRDLERRVAAAPAPMPGWKLVPVEPTPEMEQAGNDASDWHVRDADDIYRAMLAASPSPQQEGKE